LAPAIAEVLAQKFEETAQATHESLKDFIHQEFAALRADLNVRFAQLEGKISQVEGKVGQLEGKISQVEGKIGELEAKFERSLRTQLGIIIALVSLAVAIIKLFPNLY
jgi:predicted nuclease with TOPRIM domain